MDPEILMTPALVDALGRVGTAKPEAREEARLQAHWAAQVLAAFGFSYVPAVEDYSHTSIRWNADARLLTTATLPGTELVAGLEVRSLTLRLGDASMALTGKRLADAYGWMRSTVHRQTGLTPSQELKTPSHDLPEHSVADAAAFGGADAVALEELEAWFAAGTALTEAVARRVDGAGAALLWPHHFDVASLITLAGSGEDAQTIGVGLSPGDGGKPQPYWYVTPWPAPPASRLPALEGGGCWHTEGWTGAVLDAAALVGLPDGERRARALTAYVTSAIAAGITLAGRPQ